MLVRSYLKLDTKIKIIKQNIQDKHPSRLGIFRISKLFLLEYLLLISRYFLILLKNPSESFKILVNQPALAVCPYSYTDHKSFQKKVRIFSFGGLSALVGATIISSLIVNLSFGPIFQSRASTFTWTQSDWTTQSSTATGHNSESGPPSAWNQYESKDANLSLANSGADLQLASVSGSTTHTSDTDFGAGTVSNTQVSGTGSSASVKLSSAGAYISEYTVGDLATANVTISSVSGSGPWVIAFSGSPDLSRIFKNDKFLDANNKSWKILSVFDSQDKIIVVDSEQNNTSPTSSGATQATVGRWYATLSTWETGREADITAAGRNAIERAIVYYDGTPDSSVLTVDGWTTDATHYVDIYVPPSERHRGAWDANRYNRSARIVISEDYVRVDGVQIGVAVSGSNSGIQISSSASITAAAIYITNSIIKATSTSGTFNRGIRIDGGINYIYNNIIYDFSGGSDYGIHTNNNVASASYIYNNTISGCNSGIIKQSSPSFTAKNNIVQGAADGYGTGFSSSDYNLSNVASDAPSASYRDGLATTVTFVDSTAKDFHLRFDDNMAKDGGTDLSATFSNDVDGDTRATTWDIGADDVGATFVKVHSIGASSRNFSTLANWEAARDGVLTTRNVFTTTGQSAAFTEGETITGTSGATGTYIKEQDTPSASETHMTVDKVNATAFVAGDTLTGGTSGSTATLSTILTAAGTIERGEAYKDNTFTAGTTIDDSTTDSTHYMWLTAEPKSRHTGVEGTGVEVSTTSASNVFSIADASTRLEWLDVTWTDSRFVGVDITTGSNNSIVSHIITHDGGLSGSQVTGGTGIRHQSGTSITVLNSISYGNRTNGFSLTATSIYNSTAYNNQSLGFLIGNSNSTSRVINSISYGNATEDFDTSDCTFTCFDSPSSNNISSDTTAPGSGSLTSQTLTNLAFISTTANIEDFHISGSSTAKDAGTSLSSTFTTDVDLQTRPYGSAWDIGADEWSPSSMVYNSSGTFTSASINTSSGATWGNLSFTQSNGQTLSVKARSDADGDFSNATDWSSCTAVGTGLALSTGGCVTNGHQYIQYQATLSTTETSVSPGLDDITLEYTYYASSQTLTSSAYNSTDAANIIGSLSWVEDTSIPTGTTVTVSLRTASSQVGLASASWSDFTNATTNCTKSTNTVSCPLAAIPSDLKNGSGDQWFQYKVTLTSTGANTPTFSNIILQYVVNAPPDFDTSFNTTGVTATQNSDGTVTVQYRVKDADTTTGTITQGYITPSFEYSLNGGSSYTAITTTYLASTDLENKAVEEGTYTTHSATWSPKSQINGNYTTTAKIRVTINDNEAANNTANAATADFILDTTNPASSSLSVNPNAATPSTAALTLGATDNSSLQMKVGLTSDLSDASWETYSASKTITLASDPDTVYAQFKDDYNNTTSIISATTPETPTAIMIQDTSNLKLTPAEYRLFTAWKVVGTPDPGFKQYNVWRSTDNTTFTQIATVSDIDTNYYGDSTVTYNQIYYYRVSSQDSNDNISFFSSSIQAQADGIQNLGEGGGGADGVGPTISSVSTSNIQTTQATITWTTDELTNSTVGYSTDTTYSTETGVASYVTSHSVTLTGLTPATTYYFQVKSTDPSNNQTTDNNNSSGYTFTTLSGPTITNVDNEILSNTSAKIVWYTNLDSNSYVVYSSNSDLTNSTETGTTTLAGGTGSSYYHAVTLSSLTQGTTYYYYVKSTDADGNIAINNNGLNYYTFKTTQDSTSPTISDITVSTTTPDTSIITWTTNEPSTSQIEYGTTTSYGSTTTEDTDLVLTHIVSITNLTPNTTYNFKVKSKDSSTNESTSTNQTFTTLTESEIKVDQVAPTISDISTGSITSNSAIVTFTSSESCTGTINYGPTTSYGEVKGESTATTSHSITLNSLQAGTLYNYQVQCRDASDNVGQSDNQTFTILASNALAPTLTNIQVTNITSSTATITFTSSENCSGFLSYGTTSSYGETKGGTSNTAAHSINLGGLIASTTYHFKANCTDSESNVGTSSDNTFTTLTPTATGEGGKSEAEKRVEGLLNENFSNEDIQNAIKKLSSAPNITGTGPEISEIRSTSAKIKWDTDKKANGAVIVSTSKSNVDNNIGETMGNIDEQVLNHEVSLKNLVPGTTYYFKAKSQDIHGNITNSETKSFVTLIAPLISNVQVNNITLSSATITWNTSVVTTGYIEYGKDTNYGQLKQYDDIATKGTSHTLPLADLDPTTAYHFRIKGELASDDSFISSEDYTFDTQALPEIVNEEIKKVTDNSAKVTFATNIITDTQVFFRPLKPPVVPMLQRGKADLVKDHDITLTDLEFGTQYEVVIKVKDTYGNEAEKTLPTFTTGIDLDPPVITLLRTENALVSGKKDQVQTIVSWKTDEPSTTQIMYQEEIDLTRKELSNKTSEDKALTRDHVVVLTNLKSGTVYQLKAISKDSQDNIAISNNQTMLTPKQQESVFQVIMKNLEDIFGWVKRVK